MLVPEANTLLVAIPAASQYNVVTMLVPVGSYQLCGYRLLKMIPVVGVVDGTVLIFIMGEEDGVGESVSFC